MITRLLLLAMLLPLAGLSQVQAQADGRYIEVTGTSEIEIVPDRIHYIIEIREYFEEEFDGRSKPEKYRTKISLDRIEQGTAQIETENNLDEEDQKLMEEIRNQVKGARDMTAMAYGA